MPFKMSSTSLEQMIGNILLILLILELNLFKIYILMGNKN